MTFARWMTSALLLAIVSTSSTSFGDEKKIPVNELPKAVLRAAQKAFPEAQVVGASKETEDGETMFEVEMKLNGKSIDLEIDDEGEIEAVEREIEADELPKAVNKAVGKLFPNAKIAKVEEVSDEDDMVVYELTLTTDGKDTKEVVFSPNGKIMDDEAEADDEDDEKEKDKKKGKVKEKEDDDDKKGEKKPKG